MSDLKCRRCGIERSYADANIADLKQTCEIDREPLEDAESNLWGVTVPAKHDWIEV